MAERRAAEMIGVSKTFKDHAAVRSIDLAVDEGGFFSILGPSGCGKTTTLRMLAGFVHPDAGEIWLGGAEVSKLPPHRRDVNTVFQSHALFGAVPRRKGPPRLRRHRVGRRVATQLRVGEPMTDQQPDAARLDAAARKHLWMHFTRLSDYAEAPVPVIVRGDGPYIYDSNGKRYLDGLSGLFVVQAGHGRHELADAAAKQAAELGYFPLWSYAHPQAIELAARLADIAPGDINRVFFTTGGSEAVESAWKLARSYFKRTGKPLKTKVLSRSMAYHGASMGALSITGIPVLRQDFEPLVPGAVRVPNTNYYRRPDESMTEEQFGVWTTDRIADVIEFEGPDTVAAIYLEPVQNAGGCFPPPPRYFELVREICDRYDVLLVSDEVICAFGRLGEYFGARRYGYQPDIITIAKGLTSGYVPLGAMLASERLAEPFLKGTNWFAHGITYGGHPVACAVGLANLDFFERQGLNEHVRRNSPSFRGYLERLYELPIVGDVRGDGYFFGIELVKDKATKETFTDAESEALLRGFLSKALFDAGLYCRADDQGDPVIQLAPPLICDKVHFAEIEQILRGVLTAAWGRL